MQALITEVVAPTLIMEGSTIQGNLTFQSTTQIHGWVEGDVHQETLDTLNIGRTGWVKGAVLAQGPIFIEGRVDGDITSAVKIHLSPTALVHGTLTSPQIEVRPGALFEGEFKMKAKAAKQPAKRAA